MDAKHVLLGLGTNLGDRRTNLQQAVLGLGAKVIITAVSPIYETAPWGVLDQPDFYNICVAAFTNMPPLALLHFVKNIEAELGRVPSYHWGPRLIDIDILFYDDVVLQGEQLTIPHAGMADRAFVLLPLAAIAPDWQHPDLGKSVAELATAVDSTNVKELADPLFESFPKA